MTIKASKGVRWSAKYDAETRKALQTGLRRLEITVKAYEPPAGAATLVVRLLTANGTKSHEVDRFGVHPNAPFRASNAVEPQIFLISLAHIGNLLEENQIRLEVGFDSSQAEVKGGMAELSITIVDMIPKPQKN